MKERMKEIGLYESWVHAWTVAGHQDLQVFRVDVNFTEAPTSEDAVKLLVRVLLK